MNKTYLKKIVTAAAISNHWEVRFRPYKEIDHEIVVFRCVLGRILYTRSFPVPYSTSQAELEYILEEEVQLFHRDLRNGTLLEISLLDKPKPTSEGE